MKYTLLPLFSIFLSALIATGCIEDGFDSSPSAQPAYSVDTLDLGETFTLERMPTSRFVVYNRLDKSINISSVTLREQADGIFRFNVDGMAGASFRDIEVRAGDSIFVFVDASLPANSSEGFVEAMAHLDFVTNGVTSTVVLKASAIDAERHPAHIVTTSDEVWSTEHPHIVYDSLVVERGATLTLAAGTTIHFHDKSSLIVRGSLVTQGTPESPVTFTGDRLGSVVGSIPFDLMASQWEGVVFAPGSTGNSLSHTVIKNTCHGVVADTLSQVAMLNCRLRNSAGYALESRHAMLDLTGCEIADASLGAFSATGGYVNALHCTFASYYLFTAPRGPIVSLSHLAIESDDLSGMPYMEADFANSIFYGLGTDFSPSSLDWSKVTVYNCVFKSAGSDDSNFINCIWNTDPLFATVRNDYHFDYRLLPDSPVLQAADASLAVGAAEKDFYGIQRLPSPHPGAYQGSPDESE